MSGRTLSCATLAAAIGCAVIAGVFFAFSTFVMPALARLPARSGIAAMQSINITVINAVFMGALFGTALLSLGLCVTSLADGRAPGAIYRAIGGAAYCFGTIGVTIACNVPRNETLARLSPDSEEAAAYWGRFVSEWTLWNHVRGIAAVVAAVLMILALVARSRVPSGRTAMGLDDSGAPAAEGFATRM